MIHKMVSMERSAPEMAEAANPMPQILKYNYGLTLCFDQETLDKLNLDDKDVEVGDLIHLFAMAEVTSVSKHDMGGGEKCRVELQITHLSVENEDDEYEAD